MGQKPPDNFTTPVKVGDSFEDLKRKMIPFGVTKAIISLDNEGIAATLSRQLSLQDLTKIRKENVLQSIFDGATGELEDILNPDLNRQTSASSSRSNSLRNSNSRCNSVIYQIEDRIPQNLIVECLTRNDIEDTNIPAYDLIESQSDEKVRKKSGSIEVQISLKIVIDGSNDDEKMLNSFLYESSPLKACCHFIASEMMASIIDAILMESNG